MGFFSELRELVREVRGGAKRPPDRGVDRPQDEEEGWPEPARDKRKGEDKDEDRDKERLPWGGTGSLDKLLAKAGLAVAERYDGFCAVNFPDPVERHRKVFVVASEGSESASFFVTTSGTPDFGRMDADLLRGLLTRNGRGALGSWYAKEIGGEMTLGVHYGTLSTQWLTAARLQVLLESMADEAVAFDAVLRSRGMLVAS